MKNKAEQIIQSISEQLKTLSEVIGDIFQNPELLTDNKEE